MTPSDTTCNGCGRRKPTSKEHLLHVAVARVLLKDRTISTGRERDAALRRDPFFSGLKLYRNPLAGDPERAIHLDVYVENLICADCNRTWARLLEEEAGRDLYQFIHLHRPATSILREWSFYFAIKLWWANRRAEELRWGDLIPVMRAIAERDGLPLSIRVARVRGSHWNFASMAGRWIGDPPHITFIIWGVVFTVTRLPKETPVPWPSIELEEGVTRAELPILTRSQLADLLAVDRVRGEDLVGAVDLARRGARERARRGRPHLVEDHCDTRRHGSRGGRLQRGGPRAGAAADRAGLPPQSGSDHLRLSRDHLGVLRSFVLDPKKGLGWLEWVAVISFCGVAASMLAILWPWRSWKWIPPGKALLREYAEGKKRVTGTEMQRDLAIHLDDNFNHNQKHLNWLYILLMFGIGCLGLEVVSWLLAM